MPYAFLVAPRDVPTYGDCGAVAKQVRAWLNDIARPDARTGAQRRLAITVSHAAAANGHGYLVTVLNDIAGLPAHLLSAAANAPYIAMRGRYCALSDLPALVAESDYAVLSRRARDEALISLRFGTPTCLSWHGQTLQSPEAAAVFASYMARWNAHAPSHVQLDRAETTRWIRRAVEVVDLSIRSDVCLLRTGQNAVRQAGYVGEVQYEVKSNVSEIRRVVNRQGHALRRFETHACPFLPAVVVGRRQGHALRRFETPRAVIPDAGQLRKDGVGDEVMRYGS